MLAERFAQVFRQEHRQVRDLLLDLIQAFEARNLPRIRQLLGQVVSVTGPHFRYEEEALYPALTPIFGVKYIQTLLKAHDGAIAGARRLAALAEQDELSDDDVAEAIEIVRDILPHVSDCDGLSLMVERLPESEIQTISERRDVAWSEGLDLLRWASTLRRR